MKISVLVGSLDRDALDVYSAILDEYMARDDTLFVISSDFCHWGSRFQYQRYKPEHRNQPIHETIEKMDMDGVKLIEQKDGPGFYSYLKGLSEIFDFACFFVFKVQDFD